MSTNANESMKIAVHCRPWITSDGYKCNKWYGYWVAIGANPLGPRGGRSGIIADGSFANLAQMKTRADAMQYAARLSDKTGAEII